MTPLGRKRRSGLVITFDDPDMKHGAFSRDEPMVISVIAAEYRIEWVLVDQGSSANILYWSTFQKMKLPRLMECPGTLYGFAGERVPIKGTVELETVFGEGSRVRAIPVLYTVVDAKASYNIIMGRPAEVGSVWADSHVARRCYEDNLRVGSHTPKSVVNVLDFDLDPSCQYEHERPYLIEDVKEIQLGPLAAHKTKIGTTLSPEDEACLVRFLKQNYDVFAWTADDMPDIYPEFMCHRLSMNKE
ncbi:hypothetical protein CR513_13514, partial [Mucuna pruriens]